MPHVFSRLAFTPSIQRILGMLLPSVHCSEWDPNAGMIVVIQFAIHIITSSHDHYSFWHIAPALNFL